MLYSPKSIANYFLDLATTAGQPISPMKLQKLVYYAHGWFAGYTGAPLINEAVEAWQYGPVIPSLYHEFKHFGANNITTKAADWEGRNLKEVPPPEDKELCQFLRNVWTSYGQYTGSQLSAMTHASGGPWDETWKQSRGVSGTDIPFDRMVRHFQGAVETARRNAQG